MTSQQTLQKTCHRSIHELQYEFEVHIQEKLTIAAASLSLSAALHSNVPCSLRMRFDSQHSSSAFWLESRLLPCRFCK